MVTFWATFGKKWLLFIPKSGHTCGEGVGGSVAKTALWSVRVNV